MKNKKQLKLPAVDKQGIPYLSYSQKNTWSRSRREYIRTKFLKEPFITNPYIEFGSEVGEALENNDFSGFDKDEQEFLKTIPRYDEFERKIRLDMDGFYITGYIDSSNYNPMCTYPITKISDFKTGDIEKKKADYESEDYTQLEIYAAAIEQEFGNLPTDVKVILIGREGNSYKNEKLKLSKEFIVIDREITREKIDKVVAGVQKTAVEISQYYEVFLKLNV